MIWDWLRGKKEESGEWTGFLEKEVTLEGTLRTSGTFRVDSKMTGKIESDATLVFGDNAVMQGEANADRVLISGKFDGTVRSKSKVEIQSTAVVSAEIHTPCLVIQPGAVFNGNCHMVPQVDTATEPAGEIAIPIRSAATQT